MPSGGPPRRAPLARRSEVPVLPPLPAARNTGPGPLTPSLYPPPRRRRPFPRCLPPRPLLPQIRPARPEPSRRRVAPPAGDDEWDDSEEVYSDVEGAD